MTKKSEKSQGRSKDKMRVILGFVVSAAIILSIAAYILSAGSLDLSEISMFPILIVVVLLATFVVFKRARAYKAGLPMDDELEKKVKWKAGYYTFLVIIYVALGTAWHADTLAEAGTPMAARYVAYIIILASAILFFGFYFYLNKKGDI